MKILIYCKMTDSYYTSENDPDLILRPERERMISSVPKMSTEVDQANSIIPLFRRDIPALLRDIESNFLKKL